jgi:hypothetical protein
VGWLYLRGKTWWAQYSVNGRRVRESMHTTSQRAATAVLKQKEGRAALGQVIQPRVDRTRWAEAAADLLAHYTSTGSRDLAEYRRRVQHLDRMFKGRRIATIEQPDVDRYVARRQGQGDEAGDDQARARHADEDAAPRLSARQAASPADAA